MPPIEIMSKLQRPEHLAPALEMYAVSYELWLTQQISEKKIEPEALVPIEQRKTLLADWLRHLVATSQLSPRDRIPRHAALAEAFTLSTRQVSKIVFQLRQERVLAKHHRRSDAGKPRWSDRDAYILWWIGEQRAARYDQVQRLLARESQEDLLNGQKLSLSRTTQIIQRWQKAHLVTYRKIYVNQPGWIWLTRKGLAFAGLDYRAGTPSERSLNHLYYINEVRLFLEDMYEDDQLTWTSERALLRKLEKMRIKGRSLPHTPDAIAEINKHSLEIEVELTRKSQKEIESTMRGAWKSQRSTNALCYYVSQKSQATVRAAWKNIERTYSSVGYRPWVKIVDLDDLFKRPEQRRV